MDKKEIHRLLPQIIPMMRKKGVTNTVIASKMGVSKTTVSYILNGRVRLTVLQLELLCDLAGLELKLQLK